jgi:hypothetical protein
LTVWGTCSRSYRCDRVDRGVGNQGDRKPIGNHSELARNPGHPNNVRRLDVFRIYPMGASLPTIHVEPASEPSQRSRCRLTRAASCGAIGVPRHAQLTPFCTTRDSSALPADESIRVDRRLGGRLSADPSNCLHDISRTRRGLSGPVRGERRVLCELPDGFPAEAPAFRSSDDRDAFALLVAILVGRFPPDSSHNLRRDRPIRRQASSLL